MKDHILQLLDRCADVTPKDNAYALFEELIDGCDINEEYLPLITDESFHYIESLFDFLRLERRRWRRHCNETGELHWILDDRTFGAFSCAFVRASLLDRKNYLISHSESIDRLFFVEDEYNQLTEFNNFIYFNPKLPMPAWNRLVPSFHRKVQRLHQYLSSELDLKDRQVVLWYFSVLLLLYEGMETWDKATDLDSESEVFLSWCQEETMMCQYLIRRYSQSFYKEEYLKESIDGHWTSSTPNHPLNRYWYKGKTKFQNKSRHLKRTHPDPIEGLSYNDPIDLEYQMEIASLLID